MKSYLVDFENVKSKGLVGIDRLDEDDHVIIFYSENSDTISFDMHCLVMQSKANIQYMKVKVGGKNALDFQLSTLLGYMVAKELNSHIFIISNDKGFDKLHDFWQNTFADSPVCVVFRTCNILSAINFANYNTRKAAAALAESEQIAAEEQTASEQQLDTSSDTSNSENTITPAEESADAKSGAVEDAAAVFEDKPTEKSEAVSTAGFESETAKPISDEHKNAVEKAPAKRRGRPRKNAASAAAKAQTDSKSDEKSAEQETATEKKPARRRGRPRKSPAATAAAAEQGTPKASNRTRRSTKKATDANKAVNNAENTQETQTPQ